MGTSGRFERYVAVDWSASSTPKRGRDSIWIAVADRVGGEPVTTNPPTRHAALGELAAVLGDPLHGRPALVAVDVSLGYPEGTAAALGLTPGDDPPWRATWRHLADLIADAEDNTNNRFEVAAALNRRISGAATPFWGCPPSRRAPTLAPTKPAASPLPTWRHVERSLRGDGHRPFSSWQLLGAGSVGSQSLLAIPVLHRLRRRLEAQGRTVEVWPFTTGPTPPRTDADVTIVEVWPRLVPGPVDDPVPDRGQVVAVAGRLRGLDDDGELTSRLAPSVPAHLVERVVGEEGWMLDPS